MTFSLDYQKNKIHNQNDNEKVVLLTLLEKRYSVYNHKKWLFSDPLQTVYQYTHIREQELMGFVAAMCSYGRVNQIRASLGNLINRTGSLFHFIISSSRQKMEQVLSSWKHRFSSGNELALLLWGVGRLIKDFGSLEHAFLEGMKKDDETMYPGLCRFYNLLTKVSGLSNSHLLANPEKKSACKRFHLFFRWMVRKDSIDPGIWKNISPSKLLIPLDTHMLRVCKDLGFTVRAQADTRTVFEVTDAFRNINPDDPVKYDFALTRKGILKNNGSSDINMF